MKTHGERIRRGHAADLAAAVVAALALGAVGLAEIAWTPFFLVAASATTTHGCLARFRRKAARP